MLGVCQGNSSPMRVRLKEVRAALVILEQPETWNQANHFPSSNLRLRLMPFAIYMRSIPQQRIYNIWLLYGKIFFSKEYPSLISVSNIECNLYCKYEVIGTMQGQKSAFHKNTVFYPLVHFNSRNSSISTPVLVSTQCIAPLCGEGQNLWSRVFKSRPID